MFVIKFLDWYHDEWGLVGFGLVSTPTTFESPKKHQLPLKSTTFDVGTHVLIAYKLILIGPEEPDTEDHKSVGHTDHHTFFSAPIESFLYGFELTTD